ncbi:antitoxin VbhA family protein [Janthinobacterium sp. NFX145]|uniref:antitoxin VbhA family protein n=1 Tax=Janthinobacterium sp. NFX145 TaxID=3415602 RepID=UPI003CC548FB
MAKFTQQDRQRSVNQTLASWAIEGFEPDPQYLALLDRYIQGELTLVQVRAMTDVQFGVSADDQEKTPVLHAA